MLTVKSSTLFCISEKGNSRKKRSSLYFSSSKALKRSRMMRGKKVVSKTGQSSPGALRKSLRFGGGGTSGDEDGRSNVLETVLETNEDSTCAENQSQEDITVTVSIYDSHSISLALHSYNELLQACIDHYNRKFD